MKTETFKEKLSIKKTAGLNYVIDTLKEEHKIILDFLNQLKNVNNNIQNISEEEYKGKKEEIKKHLENIANHLIGAEPHHKREEKVLFIELKKVGIIEPCEVMEREHEELRENKKKLLEIAKDIEKKELSEIKKGIRTIADFLIFTLSNHIMKENDILYPMAIEAIKEKKWNKMAKECDNIGYCCFSPIKK